VPPGSLSSPVWLELAVSVAGGSLALPGDAQVVGVAALSHRLGCVRRASAADGVVLRRVELGLFERGADGVQGALLLSALGQPDISPLISRPVLARNASRRPVAPGV
jgi:hypothetical protein